MDVKDQYKYVYSIGVKPYRPTCRTCKYDTWPAVYYPCRGCMYNYKSMYEKKGEKNEISCRR